jgi:cell division protein FtsL
MPAVGGGPSPEQWKRMSKAEKIVYCVLVGAAVVFVGYLVIEKLLS